MSRKLLPCKSSGCRKTVSQGSRTDWKVKGTQIYCWISSKEQRLWSKHQNRSHWASEWKVKQAWSRKIYSNSCRRSGCTKFAPAKVLLKRQSLSTSSSICNLLNNQMFVSSNHIDFFRWWLWRWLHPFLHHHRCYQLYLLSFFHLLLWVVLKNHESNLLLPIGFLQFHHQVNCLRVYCPHFLVKQQYHPEWFYLDTLC